jgi:hypothetical protein
MSKFTRDGVTYVSRPEQKENTCQGCAFQHEPAPGVGICSHVGGWRGACCHSTVRDDNRSIIWVRAEETAPKQPSIYVIGSLRNETIPKVAAFLRTDGFDVFDDWYSAGPEADDYWKKYEEAKGHDYYQALAGFAAEHVFNFDRSHLDRCDAAVLVLPAGRSGHLELGYASGKGKPTFILHDNPERWDVMYRFATAVVPTQDALLVELRRALR